MSLFAALSLLTAGSGLVLLPGLCLLRLPPGRWLTLDALALAWTLGLAVTVPVAFAAVLAGLPLTPLAIVGVAVAITALGAACRFLKLRAGEEIPVAFTSSTTAPLDANGRGRSGEPGWLLDLAGVILAAAAAVALWKIAVAPMWSLDHFSIWGLKARRMLVDGRLDLAFLDLRFARPDHPLGVPVAWLVLVLGRRPDETAFKLLHALFGLALAAILHGEALRRTGSRAVARTLAAAALASPLLWDTEATGLAELPLALFALAAAILLLRSADEPAGRSWLPGLALGFLPWVKDEGLTLAVFLLLAAPWLLSRETARSAPASRQLPRRLLLLAAGAALPAASALAVQHWLLPHGYSFFNGNSWIRAQARILPESGKILSFCADELLASDWLGFWIVFGIATVVALTLGRRRTGALALVVWCQLLVYASTALFTYLEPIPHLRAAFFRIAAALVPLGLLALAQLGEGREEPALLQAPAHRPGGWNQFFADGSLVLPSEFEPGDDLTAPPTT